MPRRFRALALVACLLMPCTAAYAECPAGANEMLDTLAGTVCRYPKSGVRIAPVNDAGGCPVGYHFQENVGGDPYCAYRPSRPKPPELPIDKAAVQNCGAGEAPVMGTNSHAHCQLNLSMGGDTYFSKPQDCPSGTTYFVQGNVALCRQR